MNYFKIITSQRTVLILLFSTLPITIKSINNTRFWKRISDRDRLSYFMNIAFGLSLLMVSIAFITGNYIGEDNKIVNIIEIVISFALIVLGIERLMKYKQKGTNK